MKLPFAQVDAFADRPFTGNQAAVMALPEWLDDATLQAIAAENNVAETAFLVEGEPGVNFDLRWFTPTTEVALCGHATLAAAHMAMSIDTERWAVTFRTRQAGILSVEKDGEGGYFMTLPSYPPEPQPMPELLAALGLSAGETLRHPAGYDLVVLDSAEAVMALNPDFRALAALGDTLNIVTAPGTDTDVVSRVFAPAAGIDEDPVTGSAHCVLTPYWAKRLGRDDFTAYQASTRGGHVGCRLAGNDVILSGRCVTVIQGEFTI